MKSTVAGFLGGSALRRRLLSGSTWALGGKIGAAAIGIVTNGLLGHMLSKQDFGTYLLVFSIIALLKINSGAKQAPAEELLTGSIPRSPSVRKSPNDPMAAFLALDSNQSAIQPMQRAVDRAPVPLPRPRPKQ